MTARPRVAVVADGGFGHTDAVVDRLVRDGFQVAVLGTGPAAAALSIPWEADADPEEALEQVERQLGRIDALVCPTEAPSGGPFLDTDPVEWFAVVSAALTRPFRLLRAGVGHMGGGGRIVVLGTGWRSVAAPAGTQAAAVQGGIVALVKTLARELGPDGIAVNELVLDPADPPRPGAVADTVGFLCGPHGEAMVGQLVSLGRGGEVRP